MMRVMVIHFNSCIFAFIELVASESDSESERSFRFDFLIDGIYLQETLDKHMRLYNISTVSL